MIFSSIILFRASKPSVILRMMMMSGSIPWARWSGIGKSGRDGGRSNPCTPLSMGMRQELDKGGFGDVCSERIDMLHF